MTKWQSSMRSEDGKPLIKYKGIHEPRGRVKGYRVEIRPSNSPKIWVGTFDTRNKAMRAFDAAVYLTGKDPYYFTYPANYFPTPPTGKPQRDFVQSEAKKLADRTDPLQVNPSSFLVHPSSKAEPVAVEASGETDVKPVKASDPFVSLDESLKKAKYLTVSAEQIPVIETSSYWDLPYEKDVKSGGEVKYVDKVYVDEKEMAAFDKGYNNLNIPAITDLLHLDLPVDIFPWIEGESFVPFPENPCKRKREEEAIGDTDVSDFLRWFDDPVNQALTPTNSDWSEIDLPTLWGMSDVISSNLL